MTKFHLKSLFLTLALAISMVTVGQNAKGTPQKMQVVNKNNFYSVKNSFYDFIAPYDVDKNGYYIDKNGEEKRVPGYKQFKRWEWYWETRVNKTTGDFPQTRASDIFMNRTGGSSSSRSSSGSWTSLGPSGSSGGYFGLGRLNCIGFRSGDNNTYYVGSPSGGLWKTTDDGNSWNALTDDNAVLGVSEVVVLAGNTPSSDTLYIGTGDKDGGSLWTLGGGQANENNSIGVLKSVDGGATWNATGLAFQASEGKLVYRLLVNPNNHNTLYAATSDGLYKTTDSGTNWSLLTTTVFYDMEFKPGDPQTMYAGGNSDGNVYLSTDEGTTWSISLTTTGYRVVIGVSPNQSTWVYAAIVRSDGMLKGFYKSETSGASYSLPGDWINLMGANCDGSGRSQGTYDLALDVDPTNANVVFVGGINTWKTSDGGINWYLNNYWSGSCGGSVPEVHADKHFLAFQNNTATLFECNDGGVYKTTDGGTTWNYKGSGLVNSQLYRMDISQTVPEDIIAGLQDNGTKSVNNGTWADVLGGDGMDCAIDYTDNNIQYGEYQNGILKKTTDHWATYTDLGFVYGRWVSPFAVDPITHTTIYFCASRNIRFDPSLFKSTDGGSNWIGIGEHNYREFAIAPSNSDYIYGVTDDAVYKTDDGGTTWTDITGTLPVSSATPTYVAIKHTDPNTAWVAFGQYNSYSVYETTDGGATWTDISYGLPAAPVMSVVQNRQNTSVNELYAGTDAGVYVKYGTGQWELFSNGLPNVVVTELKIYYDDATPSNSRIRAATYGRGVWESDLYTYTTAAPVADFIADDTVPILYQTVLLSDFSTHQPTSWQWSITPSTFQYVDGTDATSQYPKVQFTATGYYTVQLTVSNAEGSDSKTRTNYIHAGTYHTYCSASGGGTGYISGVELESISNTGTSDDGYHDYKALTASLYKGQLEIPVTITNGITNGSYDVAAWIDFNRDGTFDETAENIVCETDNGATGTYYFDVPADADTGITVLRVRIKYSGSNCGSPCGNTSYGEVEDYSIRINDTPACPSPAYQTESNITGTSADLGWSQAGSVSSWDVRIVTQGTDTTGTAYTTTSSNPYTASSLTGNTNYEWYVRSACGSQWIGPSSFLTACTSLTAPQSENFDGVSVPDLPNCWSKIERTTGWSYSSIGTYNNYEYSAPNAVRMYYDDGENDTLLLITPQFTDLTSKQNQASFYAKGANGGETLIVGTMSDPADATTFSAYQTFTLTNAYEQYTVYFGTGYNENNTYIAFKHGMNGNYQAIFIDDFAYDVMPACPPPSNLAADSITDTSAVLSWIENGSAASWQLRLVVSGTDTTGLGYQTVTNDTIPVDTLTSNTAYDWYVRSDCSSGWSSKATFSTLCSTYSATLSENFDAVTTPDLPDCWSSLIYSTYLQASVKTYGYYAHSSPNVIFMDNGGVNNSTLMLITPELNDLTSQLNQIRFYAKTNNEGVKLIIGTMSDASDTSTFKAFKTITLTTDYTEYTVMFGSTFTENDNYIVFKDGGGDGYYPYIYIDDFVYEPMPSCPPPSDLTEGNITPTSATLSWTENGNATSWDFRIVPKDTDTTGTAYVTKTSNMIIIDTLDNDTYYDWYVRSDCGSDWAKSTFVTDCGTYTVNYSENFDAVTAPDIPHCFSTIINSSTTSAKIETGTAYNNSSPNDLQMYNSSDANATLMLITPQFTDLTTQLNQITFYAKANNNGDSLIIGTMSDPSDESTFTRFKKIELTTTQTQYTVMFGSSYNLSDEYISFKAGVGDTYKWIYIDDFYYDYMPVNPPPSDLYETNITQTTAQLGWTENGTATSWDVRIVPQNGDTAGVAYATTSNNPFTVDTLTPNTYYDWYVREHNSENWGGPSTFVTDCGSYTATYSENFDNVTAPDIPHCFSTILNSSSSYATIETAQSSYYAHSSPNHVKMYNGYDANATLMLITPQFSDLSSQQNEIRFYSYGTSGTSMVLGTMTDPANESTFTPLDTIELTTNYAEYTYYFGAAYSGTDEYIAFKPYMGGSTRTVYIDDFVYEPMPACPHPTNQSVSNITIDGATLQWVENSSSTSWDIRIVREGADTTGVSYATVTANPVTVDTLSSATYYDWYVRSSCGSDWIGPNTFVTDCDLYSAPFSENFDGVTPPELPICWSSINDSQYPTQSWVKTTANNNPYSSPNQLEMYNYYYYSTADLFLISPQLSDLTSQQNQIRFYAKGDGSNYTLIVGTMSDPSDKTTFTARKTITLSNSFAEYKVYFGGTYTLTDQYIAFKHGSTYRYQIIDIDDIHYEPITDCLTPLDQASQNINSSTEKLSWTEQGNATSWDIRIVLYGTDTTGLGYTTVSSNPLTVDTLSAGTQYSWYVRSSCGSDWVGPENFTTECAAISTFPFAEGFENSVPPLCWHNTTVVSGNVPPNWSQAASSTYYPATPAIKGNYMAQFNSKNASAGVQGRLSTQQLNFSALTEVGLTFWMLHYDRAPQEGIIVQTSTDGGTWTDVTPHIIRAGSDGWSQYAVNLSAYAGQSNVSIGFLANGNNQYDIFIDSVTVITDIPQSATWTGAIDSSWYDEANWTSPVIPFDSTNVDIPAGLTQYPKIMSNGAVCNNITIHSGATGDAALVGQQYLTVSGNATIERYLTGGRWHEVSAMTENATVSSFFFNHSPDVWMNEYIESSDSRSAIINLSTPMPIGKGFEAWVENGFDTTAVFTGSLHDTDTYVSLSFTSSAFGYNLIGNPFPSPIKWAYPWATSWNTYGIEDAVWVWDPAIQNYRSYGGGGQTLPDRIIPMGQAFFVHATYANPYLTIPLSAQVHSTQGFYKSAEIESEEFFPHLALSVSDGEYKDLLWISFAEGLSQGYDVNFDVRKMKGGDDAPQMYTVEGTEKFTIDAMQPLDYGETRTVQLNFKAGHNGVQTLTADEFYRLNDVRVILEDKKENVFQDLNENPEYRFQAVTYQSPKRFLIHFTRSVNSTEEHPDENYFFAYAAGRNLYIIGNGEFKDRKKHLDIYNVAGQKIMESDLPAEAVSKVYVPVHDNYVILHLFTNNYSYSNKVFIK